MNTKDVLLGIYSAVDKGIVIVTNVRESVEERTCSVTVEHSHLNASLVAMHSKEVIYRSRGARLTIIY